MIIDNGLLLALVSSFPHLGDTYPYIIDHHDSSKRCSSCGVIALQYFRALMAHACFDDVIYTPASMIYALGAGGLLYMVICVVHPQHQPRWRDLSTAPADAYLDSFYLY